MPPKRKLPRRGKANNDELNLETVSEERIDAITAEPLDPVKFIEVLSPDQTLRLFYNTSTLIRIAVDKGGFMQPPHFREPMSNILRKRIEEVEGKKFHFESRDSVMQADDAADGPGVTVSHRHVYFDQIMDEFYLLSPAEVYVCPVCFEHYVNTRYLPAQIAELRTVRHLRDGRAVVDPLSVLSSMQSEDPHAIEGERAPIVLNEAWDTVLAHVVFRKAAQWKAHMEKHHDIFGVGAGDYRLRDVLCTYYNEYNQWNEEKYEDEARQYGDAKKRTALTQQRYWYINARYNRLRYNRVVAAAELAEGHPEAVTESAFPNEVIAHHFNPELENDDDFIVDDDESDGDDYVPPYSPTNEGFDDDNSDDEEASEDCRPASRKSKKRKIEHSIESDSASSAASSSTSTESTSSDEEFSNNVSEQQALFKRGLLAERDCYYSRLSAEDRRFVERTQRTNVAPAQLYDPRMHRVRSEKAVDDEVVDWENIGDALAVKKTEHIPKSVSNEAAVSPSRTTMLLDEGEDVKEKLPTVSNSATPSRAPRMLLDEDE